MACCPGDNLASLACKPVFTIGAGSLIDFIPALVRPPSYGATVVAAWTSGILHMTLIQTPRILARLITLTSVPRRIVRVIIMAVLVASVSEAAAQQPSQDFSGGNDLFRGCKVLSEGGQQTRARSRGRLAKGALAMRVAPEGGRNRIMIYGPKDDGTYIVEFRTADGEA